MAQTAVQIRPAETADFRLLFNQLEKKLINGDPPENVMRVIRQKSIWLKLDADLALRWVRLAQMAGEIETALEVMAHLHRIAPKNRAAWSEHLELLSLLDRPREIARVLASARLFIRPEDLSPQLELLKHSHSAKPPDKPSDAEDPFVAMRRQERTLTHFQALFSGREDCFARQWADKKANRQGYAPVRRAIAADDLEDHFKGLKTYGIYLLQKDAHVKTAVIDADLKKSLRDRRLTPAEKREAKKEAAYLTARIKELSEPLGQAPLIEFSGGKGLHFWFFWERPVPAGDAQSALVRLCSALKGDLGAFTLEVFPKQARLSRNGLGNLVKLPLGVHRQTGKRSFFIECGRRTLAAQLAFLEKVCPAKALPRITADAGHAGAAVLTHPRWQKWAKTYPELDALHRCCPPLGQVIQRCRTQSELTLREEKVIYQTIGFLPRRKLLLHYLLAAIPDYNPHEVDYKLSRVRGTPLGCRRIHALLNFSGDYCPLETRGTYAHPLLHLDLPNDALPVKVEKIENLTAALDHLKTAIGRVERFMR